MQIQNTFGLLGFPSIVWRAIYVPRQKNMSNVLEKSQPQTFSIYPRKLVKRFETVEKSI